MPPADDQGEDAGTCRPHAPLHDERGAEEREPAEARPDGRSDPEIDRRALGAVRTRDDLPGKPDDATEPIGPVRT